jgi:hypothetical protein
MRSDEGWRGTIVQSGGKIPPPKSVPAEVCTVSRDNEPVVGQWYEIIDEDETFRVISVDEDEELVEIEYLDGETDKFDLEEWHELDLELIEEPEGWSEDDDEDEEDDEDWDEEDEDEEDEDWDEEDEDEHEDDHDDGRER